MANASPIIPNIMPSIDPSGTPQPMDARGHETVSIAPQMAQLGGQLDNSSDTAARFELERAQAQQNVWLTKAKSDSELQAQKMVEDAQRSAQPGEPITGKISEAWDKHMSDQLDTVQNPIAKSRLSEAMQNIGGSALKTASAFDYQQQDAQVTHNIHETLNNKASLYAQMRDMGAVTPKALQDIGEMTSNIQALPLPPDKKLELIDYARKGLVYSALDAKTAIDPIAVLNENAPARSPDARLNDPNMPRGIRNNNPGNLEGDQGFQGFKGTDDKGYATFETPEAGLRAMAINLRNQQDLHGLNTVRDIMTKYAPPGENDTQAYIGALSAQLSVKPDDTIDLHEPATLAKMMQGVIKQENGVSPYASKSILYAATAAAKPGTEGESPGPMTPDGRIRTGDPLFALLKPEEQQAQIQHMEAVYRQQQYFQRQGNAIASSMLGQMKESLDNGYVVPDDQIQELKNAAADAKSPALQTRINQAIVRNTALRDFQPMAPDQLQDYLQNSLKPVIDSRKATPDQVERYDTGLKFLSKMNEQLKTNQLEVFSRATQQPIPDISANTADAYRQRAIYSASSQKMYNEKYIAFTPSEVPRIAATFASAPPIGQREMLLNMARGFGPHTAEAAAQVFGKDAPEIAYAANMLAIPNITDAQAKTAMDIVAGAQRIKDDKAGEIPLKVVDTAMASQYATTPGKVGLPPVVYDKVLQAARAVYAARYSSTSTPDTGGVSQAIKDALGGEQASVNGNTVVAPSNVPGATFEKFVSRITPMQMLTAMQKANQMLGGKDAAPRMPESKKGQFNPNEERLRLQSIGNGMYQMLDENNRPYPAKDQPGGTAKLYFDPSDVVPFERPGYNGPAASVAVVPY